MLRKLIFVGLPILLPFLVYGFYLLLARRKERLAASGQLPSWQKAPWWLLIVSAAVLCLASLVTYRFTVEEAPQPPAAFTSDQVGG